MLFRVDESPVIKFLREVFFEDTLFCIFSNLVCRPNLFSGTIGYVIVHDKLISGETHCSQKVTSMGEYYVSLAYNNVDDAVRVYLPRPN